MITTMTRKGKDTVAIPEAGEGKRGAQADPGYLLRQAYNASRQAFDRLLEELEVTSPQFLIMTMINAYPGISSAEVARLTMLTPQTISLIIANLERDGRLARSASPDHGRIQNLQLTEEGKALLARCRERAQTLDALLRADLSPEDEQTIRRWLVAIATSDLSI
jgi:DNA-binding MarR family transcriptional regulator